MIKCLRNFFLRDYNECRMFDRLMYDTVYCNKGSDYNDANRPIHPYYNSLHSFMIRKIIRQRI